MNIKKKILEAKKRFVYEHREWTKRNNYLHKHGYEKEPKGMFLLDSEEQLRYLGVIPTYPIPL